MEICAFGKTGGWFNGICGLWVGIWYLSSFICSLSAATCITHGVSRLGLERALI